MRQFLLCFVTALLLCKFLGAQSQVPVYRGVAPQYAGTYSMRTGEWSDQNTASSQTIYNNNNLTNYYSIPGQDQEWVDEGQFCGQDAIQIDGFNFTYCSTEADPTQNSGTITFTFYDDFTICAGPTNGENFVNGGYVCAYDVVGLPLGDPNGDIQCWIVTLDLSGGFECPNTIAGKGGLSADEANGKLFGWGIIPRRNNTGPWLANGGKGADNSFVWFDSFGIFQGCFWFGGAPFASFAVGVTGCDDGSIYCYVPSAPLSGDQSNMNVSVGPGTLTVDNFGDQAWLVASSASAQLPLGSCTALVDPAGVLAPTPIPALPGLNIYPTPPCLTVYIQLFETANGAPPSMGNLPVEGSNAYRIVTKPGGGPSLSLDFHQLDLQIDGVSTPNSDWGSVDVTFTGTSEIQYFNLSVNDSWQVVNIPVQSVDGVGILQTINYDFDLGVSSGTDVSDLSYGCSLTTFPLSCAPASDFTALVGDRDVILFSGILNEMLITGGPRPLVGDGVANNAKHVNTGFPNQDCGENECAPAAASNSLMFLNSKHNLGMAAADITIDALKTALNWMAPGVVVDWPTLKHNYLQGKNYPVTTWTTTNIADVITALDGDCAVEITAGGHAAAIVGVKKLANGKYSITVKHDTDQKKAGGTKTQTGIYDPVTMKFTGPKWFNDASLHHFCIECPTV